MIELAEVEKAYGSVRALKGISLQIREGEFLGLVGPNGAGKTTLMRILLGLEKPTSGRILINSREPSTEEWISFRRKTGYMPERVSFYDNLTGMETLKFFARIKGYGEKEIRKVISLNLLSEETLNRRVGEYSKGMKQRINLMQALLGEPKMLILDEPTSGLDPEGVRSFYSIIETLRKNHGATVIISTHILAEIENRVDKVVILKEGRLKAVGSLEELYMSLNLPILFLLKIKGKAEEISLHLKKIGAEEVKVKGDLVTAEVPVDRKVEFLMKLGELEENIYDIRVREPSLEEVFFSAK